MTQSNDGLMRQSALCFLTFLVGIAAALSWPHIGSVLIGIGTAPVAASIGTSVPWQLFATLGGLTVASAAAIYVGFKLAAKRSTAAKTAAATAQRARAAMVAAAAPIAEDDVAEARAQVERQLAELVGYVSRYLDTTSEQDQVFATAQTNLANAGTVEQVQEVIKLLIANNTTARKNADELKARLTEAQTESAKLQASLSEAEALATMDGLTNLPNRRQFQASLEAAVAACHREHTPLCLVMSDLDHFKAINDKHGHLSGDAVLKSFAQILSKGVRSTDVAARYGGEEFALILPKTPLGNASVVAESLRRTVAELHWTGATPKQRIGRLTASFGVAEIREDETVEQLIDRADQKLYEAKRRGRNRVEIDHTDSTD